MDHFSHVVVLTDAGAETLAPLSDYLHQDRCLYCSAFDAGGNFVQVAALPRNKHALAAGVRAQLLIRHEHISYVILATAGVPAGFGATEELGHHA